MGVFGWRNVRMINLVRKARWASAHVDHGRHKYWIPCMNVTDKSLSDVQPYLVYQV